MVIVAGGTVQLGRTTMLAIPQLRLECGELVALTGPSGSGKSTALAFMRYGKPGLAARNRRAHPEQADDIALVTQEPGLFPTYTVLANLVLGCWPRPLRSLPAARRRALSVLEELDLSHLRRRGVVALSGGEQKRISVARGLCRRAHTLLVDEPTSGLDPVGRSRVIDALSAYVRSGSCIVAATHDEELIRRATRQLSIVGTASVREVREKSAR